MNLFTKTSIQFVTIIIKFIVNISLIGLSFILLTNFYGYIVVNYFKVTDIVEIVLLSHTFYYITIFLFFLFVGLYKKNKAEQ